MKKMHFDQKTLRTILQGLFKLLSIILTVILVPLISQPKPQGDNSELHETYNLYDGYNYEVFDASSESFCIGANSYNCGFTITSCPDSNKNTKNSFVLIDLQNKYSSISFVVGRLNNSLNHNATLVVFLDNKLLDKYKLCGQVSTQTITIETKNKSTLRFELISESKVTYGFSEFYLNQQ